MAIVSGMRGVSPVPAYVVMQPTTLCNLDCSYCYLPLRADDRRMSVAVAEAVAADVNRWADGRRFSVVWHGGEPMAAGREHLASLMAPFDAGVEHHIQTNATLIDDAWCDFFHSHQVRVSVSVDGPEAFNQARINRARRPAYQQIMKGIAALRRHDLPFAALCVVSQPRPGVAAPLYGYFLDLGCDVLGINIEEREGVNRRANAHVEADVRAFWAELTEAWRAAPRLHLREIEWTLRYVGAVLEGTADELLPRRLDPIPTVSYDGSVVLLSPELAGFHDPRYADFTSGNVLNAPLSTVLQTVADTLNIQRPSNWIAEYVSGVESCRGSCPYFGFCGGGHAANRYFEHGRFDGTQTEHCRNSKIHLLEGVLDHVRVTHPNSTQSSAGSSGAGTSTP